MVQFYPLTVTNIEKTSRNAVIVSLTPSKSNANKFTYQAGQYLTLRKSFGNDELRRSYSICSSTRANSLKVGIKKVDGGGFSTWANQHLKVGDTIDAMSPMGRFIIPEELGADGHYLAIAVGSGITPIISIVKTLLEDRPKSQVTILYGNRSVADIMLREEIEDLKNEYFTRLSVHHVLSSGSDIDILSGRIDAQKCSQFLKVLPNSEAIDCAFICGPEDMMTTVSAVLVKHGVAEDRIKFELFGAPQEGRRKTRPKKPNATSGEARCSVSIIVDGVRNQVDVMGRETSVLDAALNANISAPFACKAGVCSTCRARVVEGEYEFVTNYALEDYEVEQGFVLTCQCFPTGKKLVVDYDH